MPGVSLWDIPGAGGRSSVTPPIFAGNSGGGAPPGVPKQIDPQAQVLQSLMMANMVQQLRQQGGGGLLSGLFKQKAGTASGDPLGTGALTNTAPDTLLPIGASEAPIFL